MKKLLENVFKAFLILIILFSSCKRPDALETNVIFLGHKGSGNNNYNDRFIENTLPSMQNAINAFDGVEADVQMSLDGTLWMFHDANVNGLSCNAARADTIPRMTDIQIQDLKLCHKGKSDRIYKLSELLSWANESTSGIYISLDIKVDFSRATFSMHNGKKNYLVNFANRMTKMFEGFKYSNKVFVEVDDKPFCDILKANNATKNIGTFFMRYEPLPRKINNAVILGYDGISCNYTDPTVTAENIQIARNAGLKVQLWTPYYRDELRKAFGMNPDIIQSDNVYVKQALNVK